MRVAFAWFAVLGLGLGACDNGKSHLHPEAGMDSPVDAAPPPWYRPTLGMEKDWDIQLGPPYDVTMRSKMYVLDLWDVSPATTITYDDASTVTVPAGPLAGKIDELHARGVKVVCHFDTGAIHLDDPDAMKFPGYEASPPDRPTPPKADSVIGWSFDADNLDLRFLDVRTASRPLWTKFMWKRFDLAKQIGCDGTDGDRNYLIYDDTAPEPYTGFRITVPEQVSWYREIATQSHSRLMGAGMRNGQTLPNLVDTVAPDFDYMMIERCGQYNDCDQTRTFINLSRVVFAIDYVSDEDGAPNFPAAMCQNQTRNQIEEGVIKDDAISSAMRTLCDP